MIDYLGCNQATVYDTEHNPVIIPVRIVFILCFCISFYFSYTSQREGKRSGSASGQHSKSIAESIQSPCCIFQACCSIGKLVQHNLVISDNVISLGFQNLGY